MRGRELMADKALAALKSLWSKLPIKAPWKVCRVVFAHPRSPALSVLARSSSKAVGCDRTARCGGAALADALVQRALLSLCAC